MNVDNSLCVLTPPPKCNISSVVCEQLVSSLLCSNLIKSKSSTPDVNVAHYPPPKKKENKNTETE